MSNSHVTQALLIACGCPVDKLDEVMDQLGHRVPPDSVLGVLDEVHAAIITVLGRNTSP